MKSLARGILGILPSSSALAIVTPPAARKCRPKPDIIEVIEIRGVITDGTAARSRTRSRS
jgi:hypothetical protein